MLIDVFNPRWLVCLDEDLNDTPEPYKTFLLIDGAFAPGLHRKIQSLRDNKIRILFEGRPGCNETTRDVSPFVVEYSAFDEGLKSILHSCSGWPMISAITTVESIDKLACRLAAWCVVETDGQFLNLRFPDTRRLPDILSVMDYEQRATLVGPAIKWWSIGRDGNWTEAAKGLGIAPLCEKPSLNACQFESLVDRSEADAILAQAWYLNLQPKAELKSIQYKVIERALALARNENLGEHCVDWCHFCFEETSCADSSTLEHLLMRWKNEILTLFESESEGT